jgi:hypothetical protein
VQGELLIVHLNTYVVPAVPVNVLVGLVGVMILPPVPETIVHNPVPIVGVLPVRAVLVRAHIDAPIWSAPAFETVGFCWKVTVTSSKEAVQGLLLIVHRKT